MAFECIPEVLHRKQQLFADLTALLDQRGVAARDVLLCTCTLSLSIRSISMGAMTPYKSRLIGWCPSSDLCKVTFHGEQHPSIALIRKLACGAPVVAFEETAADANRKLTIPKKAPVKPFLQPSGREMIRSGGHSMEQRSDAVEGSKRLTRV